MSTERNYWFEHGEHSLCVNVTHEGVIMDVYGTRDDDEDEPLATVGMTSDEWIEWVINRDS